MNRFKTRLIGCMAACTATLLLFSCAEDSGNQVPEWQRDTFDAWVTKNAPNAKAYQDIYIEYIERNETGKYPVLEQCFVQLNYTGRVVDGSVWVTRDSLTSLKIGRYLPSTHYGNQLIGYSKTESYLSEGFIQGLREMRAGDSARIYIPADKGYASAMAGNSAYFGQQIGSGTLLAPYQNVVTIIDVRLAEVVDAPNVWVREKVDEFAREKWGMTTKDSVLYGVYMRKIKECPDSVSMKDSSGYIFYAQYFLDGFLCATNIDTIAQNHKVYSTDGDYSTILVGVTASASQKIYDSVMQRMRAGEIMEVVTIPYWGYGDNGQENHIPEIQRYQPLVYRITNVYEAVFAGGGL